mmetsp:Transcript_141881/g.453635  ORF Transcript_141881/g.453635 Transcript_141881/m.453635 type:complete len:303 (-) Transcript_141881:1605-2513(-)
MLVQGLVLPSRRHQQGLLFVLHGQLSEPACDAVATARHDTADEATGGEGHGDEDEHPLHLRRDAHVRELRKREAHEGELRLHGLADARGHRVLLARLGGAGSANVEHAILHHGILGALAIFLRLGEKRRRAIVEGLRRARGRRLALGRCALEDALGDRRGQTALAELLECVIRGHAIEIAAVTVDLSAGLPHRDDGVHGLVAQDSIDRDVRRNFELEGGHVPAAHVTTDGVAGLAVDLVRVDVGLRALHQPVVRREVAGKGRQDLGPIPGGGEAARALVRTLELEVQLLVFHDRACDGKACQ